MRASLSRFFTPLAFVTAIALVAGCGSSDDSPSSDSTTDGGSTTQDAGADTTTDDASHDADLSDVAQDSSTQDAAGRDAAEAGADVASDSQPPPQDAGSDTNRPDSGGPTIPVLPHKTDFLTTGCFTHTFAGLDAAKRKSCLQGIVSRRYTHFYLYAYNEKDYGGPSFDFYANPSLFRARLKEVRAAGLAPVVWLVPDDAPVMSRRSVAQVSAMMDKLIPKIDDLVSSYVLGLELDEYWNAAKVDALGKHLRSLTRKKIGVHQLQGHWNYAKFGWCDYMVLQYGFGLRPSQITQMTRRAIADLHKPVVAGEYALKEKDAIPLGNAGVAAGSSGFGNGGTP